MTSTKHPGHARLLHQHYDTGIVYVHVYLYVYVHTKCNVRKPLKCHVRFHGRPRSLRAYSTGMSGFCFLRKPGRTSLAALSTPIYCNRCCRNPLTKGRLFFWKAPYAQSAENITCRTEAADFWLGVEVSRLQVAKILRALRLGV